MAVSVAGLNAEICRLLPTLDRLALRLCHKNRDRADDLLQDTIERALSRSAQFEAGTYLLGWLCTIMRNRAIDLRRSRQRGELLGHPETISAAVAAEDTQGAAIVADLRRTLAQLPAPRRRVVLLAARGETYAAIAAIERVPLGTVMSRLFRGRAELRCLWGVETENPYSGGRLFLSAPLRRRRKWMTT